MIELWQLVVELAAGIIVITFAVWLQRERSVKAEVEQVQTDDR